jgi:hypothetical protein
VRIASSSRLGLRRLLGARPRANTNASSLARSRPPRLIAPAGLLLAGYAPNDAGHSGRRGRVDQTCVLSPRESEESHLDEMSSRRLRNERRECTASSLVKSGFLNLGKLTSRENPERISQKLSSREFSSYVLRFSKWISNCIFIKPNIKGR